MPGGIIQIAVYGSQDIFLTGTPQITFFKIVYRRYTNFAIEQVPQQFIGITNFGYEMSMVVDKLGDLMYKTYLEIDLPEVNLCKDRSNYKIDHVQAHARFKQLELYYQLVCSYIATNMNVVRQLHDVLKVHNITMQEIEVMMSDARFVLELEEIRSKLRAHIINTDNYDCIPELVINKQCILNDIPLIDIHILFHSIYPADLEKKCKLLFLIRNQLYGRIQEFYCRIYQLFNCARNICAQWKNNAYEERYAFAWVEEIGNAIIDQIDIKIGPQLIDRQTGDWMILYNTLNLREYQKHNYYKMIGQVPQLIVLNDGIRPRYKLIIPLLFWFSRYNGLALPLIALRYHDVLINLRLKDLSQLCYVEDCPELPTIPEIQAQYNINIESAVLYVDYVFLDSDERKRFAQSTHEYLIETIQYNEFCIPPTSNSNIRLTFAHPCRYMVFFCQPKFYRHNPTGRNKCQWNNFATCPSKLGQPVSNLFIRLNSTEITDTSQPIVYFNYVQPYMHFLHSPTDGLYSYSFSLNPTELQPDGTCNFSRIDDVSIEYTFNKEFLDIVCHDLYEPMIYIATYVVTYNVLRIMSGMAGLAFQTST
jgi:hypothetical protein